MGLFALSLSIAAAVRSPAQLKAERGKLGRAEAAWKDAKTAFEQAAGNGFFAHLRQEAELLISRLNETNAEETRRLADLANRKRELQLRHYLDRHHIDRAKIKGIGSGRKLTLKSFGIETAGDVERSKILAISGFGPATADLLQNWRRRLEASFHFDPNRAIDPADIAAIKAEIANRRVDLAGRVRHTIARLEKASSDASALRSNPGSEAIDAWTAWKSADQFERELRPSRREAGQLLGVAAISLAAVWISAGLQHSLIVPTGPRVQGKATDLVPRQIEGDHEIGPPLSTPHESTTGSGGAEASRRSVPGSEAAPNVPAENSSEPLSPQASISRDATGSMGGTLPTESPFPSRGNVQKGADATTSPTLLPSYPHQQIPLDRGTVAGVEPAVKGGSLDLLDRSNATHVQGRLRALGYTHEAPDGLLGCSVPCRSPRLSPCQRPWRRRQLGRSDGIRFDV